MSDAEEFGPPAPLRLWTYRYHAPRELHARTLDCAAVTVEQALRRAQRFIRREQRRYLKAGIAAGLTKGACRIRLPRSIHDMKLEG